MRSLLGMNRDAVPDFRHCLLNWLDALGGNVFQPGHDSEHGILSIPPKKLDGVRQQCLP